jgi:predicted XRE-type DNA-binding protein
MNKNKVENKSLEIEESSGNVFKDLEIHNAQEYLAKAELARQINKIIKNLSLTQKEAAKLLNIDQPKISYLNKGLLTTFSIERLLKFLALLNQDIEIVITPHKNEHFNTNLSVRYANC